ncbi:LysE family translocator [Histidinibacterium aquaticum]|uniref:LysE family translocator n=1 Tax=Histidinibacterium aquaticum TaxID=2613962 RepID=A0A5J5GHD9_9RHOB|nr:LysE family translocator [Histidinibacterium aquaticum]
MGPLAGFVFLGLFSPGPNVILLTASGARFGFRRTVPHLLGVALGVGVTSFVTGLGVGSLLLARPGLTLALKIVACLWILWMAVQLWRSDPVRREAERPFTLTKAVLFQWVNPKVWAVALAATAFVAELGPLGQAATLGLTFSVINLGVCLFWTSAGSLLSRLLSDPAKWRLFMRGMAVALAAFAGLVFL